MFRTIVGCLMLCVAPAAVAHATAAGVFSGASAADAPSLDTLLEGARASNLHEDRRWRLLLHFGKGATESQADAPSFFLSPRGKHDPRAELEATLRAFVADGSGDAHARCRFPARFRFVSETLAIREESLPSVTCPEYDKWRASVDAGSATLVFASAQVEVPASMYGHTFLRLDKRGARSGSTLLSTIVNYAATPDSANPIVYTIKGLNGGFPGRFQAMPYFVKVAEYTNHESRELWEYPLTLSPDQMDWMIRHLWELDATHFDYYFLTENCSYHLLALLELAAAKPLKDGFRRWTIPVDTVRVAREAGLAGEPVLRPSHLSLLRARRDMLEEDERDLVARLSDASTKEPDWKALHALAPERQALVLDTAFDYLKYRYGFVGAADDASVRRERTLLLERSTLKAASRQPVVPRRPPPDSGHDSMHAGVGIRVSGTPDEPRVVQEIHWRPALHDLLDIPQGYSNATQLDMFSWRVRVDSEATGDPRNSADVVSLERFDVVNVDMLRPWEEWVHGSSWGFALGAGRVVDAGCAGWRCTAADARGRYGIAAGSPDRIGYLRFGGIAEAGGPYAPSYRVIGTAGAGVLAQLGRHWRLHADAEVRYDALGGTPAAREPYPVLSLGQAVDLGSSTQLRLTISRARETRESMLSVVAYF